MKRFYVFGASGFVGRTLCQQTDENRWTATHHRNPITLRGRQTLPFDVARDRFSEFKAPEGFEASHAVILLGDTEPDSCKRDPERSRAVNVEGIKRLIQDLVDSGIRPVFASTEFVFDGKKGGYVEEDPVCPNTLYGEQKVEVEEFLKNVCDHYVVLRFPKVLGSTLGDKTMLSNWIAPLKESKWIRCAVDQRFSATHVLDIVQGVRLAIEKDLRGVYHLCSPESYSRPEMLKILADELGVEPKVELCEISDFDFLDNRPLDVSLDPKRIMNETGISFRNMRGICQDLVSQL